MLSKLKFAFLFLLIATQANAGLIRTHHETVPEIGVDAVRTTPDPASSSESFKIDAGQTVVISGTETCKDIYVNGMGGQPAVLELTNGCELRVQTIFLAGPQAVLRTTPGQAISCRVVWRDLPLDLVNDPQQFGNGLVCISGTVTLSGANPRQAKADVAAEIRAGQTTITLTAPPTNWKAGDEIWLPDTRQPSATSGARQVENLTVASVAGNVVTLTAPVAFDHLGWHASNGSVGELFAVANVTQSIVFQSENPDGTRGHMIFMDHSFVDAEGYSLRDMGRTTTEPLHSTIWTPSLGPSSITQLGDNQIGRYVDHDHGNPGRSGLPTTWQTRRRSFSIVGSPKWGRVLHHATHYAIHENFAIVDCAGSHIVTETPNVSANVFHDGIIIAKTSGSGQRITDRAHRNLAGGDHWHDAVGLGLQSVMNEFTNIDLYSCKESIGLAGFRTTQLRLPPPRGQHQTTANSPGLRNPDYYEYPLQHPLTDVRAWGGHRGVETWTLDCYPNPSSISPHRFFPGLELIHCRIPTNFEDQRETALYDWRILGDFAQVVVPTPTTTADRLSYGLNWKDSYRFGISVTGGEIRGYGAAYELVFDIEDTTFTSVDVECPCVMFQPLGHMAKADLNLSWVDCTFTPVNGTLVGITGWLPKYGLELWLGSNVPRPDRQSLNDVNITFRPWADGRHLDVYHYEQQASFALAPVTATEGHGDWPLGVWTHQQLIALGTPIFGAVAPATAVPDPVHFGRFLIDDVTVKVRFERLEAAVEELQERVMTLEGTE